MTGFTLWTFPQLTDTIPWIRGCLHSNATVAYTPELEMGYCRSHGYRCQLKYFCKSETQFGSHIVNKRLTSGLVRQQHCGKWCTACVGQQRALFEREEY